MTSPSYAVLPVAHLLLRLLVVLNALMGGAILVLLFFMPNRAWIMSAFDLSPSAQAERVIMGLRLVATLGVVVVAVNHLILRRLRAIVDTVRDGDPFVAMNAARLQAIAWMMLCLQLLSITIAAIGRFITSPSTPVRLDAGFSFTAWLAIVLTFVLARVFAEGTRMRDDLEGTV